MERDARCVGAGDGDADVADAPTPKSLRVLEGTGGMMTLGDGDKDGISQTIDEEVLKGTAIEFRSTDVQAAGDGEQLRVDGELELFGKTAPVSFDA